MSQNNKTLIFIALAAVVVLAVFLTRPAAMKTDSASVVGEKLIADFKAVDAADLEIVDFNEATGELQPFEVKQVESKGRTLWSIPSHSNYPADAKDQVAQAASSLLGLAILGVKGDSQDDHETYGVLDSKDVKQGSRGVGMKVTLRDKKGKDLVALIVGKEVPDHKGQRYVRLVGQNPVYIVAMKTDSLSSRFDRWIEKSLLQISPWDISKLWIRDHAVDAVQGQLIQRGEIVLQFNDQGKPQWELLDNRIIGEKGAWESIKLAADQELNAPKLDELKTALSELQIVDVAPKPEIFRADLKAKGDKSSLAKFKDILAEYGFHWADVGNGPELYSNNGEIRCLMNSGVEYVLRFGDMAYESTATGSKDEKTKDAKEGQDEKKDEKKGAGVNRYLFVMAQFNPAGIPKPKETPLPGEKPAEGAAPPAKEAKPAPSETKPADETKPAPQEEKKPADESKPAPQEEKKPADETKPAPQEEKKPVEAKPTAFTQQNPAEEKPADAKPAETKPVPVKSTEEKPADAQKAPEVKEKPTDTQKAPAVEEKAEDANKKAPAGEEKPVEGKPAAAVDHPEENPIALPTDPKALEAAREKVEKENQRAKDEYKEKLTTGKKRVEELNARFADWFYIISDETYRKIHLSRENLIIKKTEKKEEKPGEPGNLPSGAMDMPPGFLAPGGK